MYEIELKAHVKDRKSLAEKLKVFAKFLRHIKRSDEYYHLPAENSEFAKKDAAGKSYISVRLRTETSFFRQEECKTFFTYKRKELRTGADGTMSEVNDEKECILSDGNALKAAFEDAGFTLAQKKQKDVEEYEMHTPFGKAAIELCSVPPLGDFLEIEILSSSNDDLHVKSVQKELMRILDKAEIPPEQIEKRYYSELLAEAEINNRFKDN